MWQLALFSGALPLAVAVTWTWQGKVGWVEGLFWADWTRPCAPPGWPNLGQFFWLGTQQFRLDPLKLGGFGQALRPPTCFCSNRRKSNLGVPSRHSLIRQAKKVTQRQSFHVVQRSTISN